MITWAFKHIGTGKTFTVRTYNVPIINFEEWAVYTGTENSSWVAGPHAREPLELVEEDVQQLKDAVEPRTAPAFTMTATIDGNEGLEWFIELGYLGADCTEMLYTAALMREREQ